MWYSLFFCAKLKIVAILFRYLRNKQLNNNTMENDYPYLRLGSTLCKVLAVLFSLAGAISMVYLGSDFEENLSYILFLILAIPINFFSLYMTSEFIILMINIEHNTRKETGIKEEQEKDNEQNAIIDAEKNRNRSFKTINEKYSFH